MCYNAIVEEAGAKPCFFFFIMDSSFELKWVLPISPNYEKIGCFNVNTLAVLK